MAILRQQKAFVEKLYASGMVDEGEMHHMMEHIQERQVRRGPPRLLTLARCCLCVCCWSGTRVLNTAEVSRHPDLSA